MKALYLRAFLMSLISVSSASFIHAQCWQQVAVNAGFTLAIKNDGRLWAWGKNNKGQLGRNNFFNYSTPVQVGSSADWSVGAAGYEHSAAVKTDGSLWTWGSNSDGQLGDGTNVGIYPYPRQVGNETNWLRVYAALNVTMAIKTDGTLWAWGSNFYGMLGNGGSGGSSPDVLSPQQVGLASNWVSIMLSNQSALGLRADGTLWSWGWNSSGVLGNGSTTHQFTPQQVGSASNWSAIAIGLEHGLGLRSDGSLWTWGSNDHSQLGNGSTTASYTPQQVGTDMDWVSVSSGGFHSVAVKSNGTAWAWGYNHVGQLGLTGSTTISSPQQIGSVNSWAKPQLGMSNASFGIRTDGSLWAWGGNTNNQLGTGIPGNSSTPTDIGCATVVLPVRLFDLSGRQTGNFNTISWKTANEYNSEVFEIEYSKDGVNFIKVGSIPAAGFSGSTLSYSYKHQPLYERSFYRIKIIDLDGNRDYSAIIEIENGSNHGLGIYPNPATDFLKINSRSNLDFDKLIISDITGRTMLEINGYQTLIPLKKLSPGAYLLRFYKAGKIMGDEVLMRQ
ncbi:MAG: T9SS type A sorting domain-containing protein [Chitinophagaceae bacterium]|nr:MAG: T9SS type A sorting domain-containing protein [Chitinophagaceae bacterium]